MPHRAIFAFVAGIAVVAWLPMLVPGLGLLLLAALAVLGLIQRWFGWALFGLGMVWCGIATHQAMEDRWPDERAGEIHWVEGTVVGLPEWSNQSLRFRLSVDHPDFPELIETRWYRARTHLKPGETYRFPLALTPPTGRLNFSGFDYERYLLTEGIGALARVRTGDGEPTRVPSSAPPTLMARVHRWRQIMAEQIQATTTDLDVAAVKRALLVGDRRAIDDDLQTRLQATGTAHLLAISGLHIGMMAGLGFFVGALVWAAVTLAGLRSNRARLAMVIGWGCAAGYAALAGFSLPTQRALIMLTVAMLAVLARRRVSPVDGLLWALVVVLLIDPLSILTVGLWLSFAAVGFLIWGLAWRTQTPKWRLPGRELIRAQWLVMVGLAPLSIGVFGQWVPGAFVANLVAIPWVSFVVLPTTVLATALSWIEPSAAGLTHVADGALLILLDGLGKLSVSAWSAVDMASVAPAMVAVGLVGAGWLLSPAGWPARGLGAVLLLAAMLTPRPSQERQSFKVTAFDVGSGLAVLVEQGDYRLLFDTGPGDGQGRDVLGDILNQQDRRRRDPHARWVIDDAVLSWNHRAYRGGLGSLLSQAWIRRIHQSFDAVDEASSAVANTRRCQRGVRWSQGVTRFEFLHPGPHLPDLGGNSSCVLWIQHPQTSLLLVSGLDAVGEAHVLKMNPHVRADTVLAARSGHASATSAPWMDQLDPSYVLISVAKHDRHQRPDVGLIDRAASRGAEVFQTATCGAIELTWHRQQAGPSIRTAVDQRRRFWHGPRNC